MVTLQKEANILLRYMYLTLFTGTIQQVRPSDN